MASIFNVNQDNAYYISFDLVDKGGDALTRSVLGTLYLTQYYYNSEVGSSDRYHLATINGRFNQVVFAGGTGSMNVTVSAAATVGWTITQDDTPKLSSSQEELHIALFTWQWGGLQNSKEFYFNVRKVNYAV